MELIGTSAKTFTIIWQRGVEGKWRTKAKLRMMDILMRQLSVSRMAMASVE